MLKYLVALFAVSASAMAQPTTAPAGADAEIITRVYEITDLQMQKRDYPAPRNEAKAEVIGGGGQNLFAGTAPTSQPSAQDITDSIIRLIQDTVATETWKDN